MNIQLPVLLWTVICFCAFAFVINTFLFKPILKVMDARREKIDGAKKKAEALERQRHEAEEKAALLLQQKKTEHAEKVKADILEFNEFSEKSLNEMRENNEKRLESKRSELKAAAEENHAVIIGKMDSFVAAFTEKLTSYR